jgi:hypothetical protein
MADVPVEVKKAAPAETTTPDVWRSFRGEMDRLFDRFGFPSLRRMFDMDRHGGLRVRSPSPCRQSI